MVLEVVEVLFLIVDDVCFMLLFGVVVVVVTIFL